MRKRSLFYLLFLLLFCKASAQQVDQPFNGLGMGLGNLPMLSTAKTRSISGENFSGEKGRAGMAGLADSTKRNMANAAHNARELGQGWKLNPYIRIKKGETFTLANITGPGAIQHIWMTPQGDWRLQILRIYWDDEKTPSVECPIADFFAQGFNSYAHIASLPIAVNPGNAFNSYFLMPFRKKCRITIQNLNDRELALYFQIDYTLTPVPKNMAYFHAQFRRSNPNKTSLYTLVDGIKGRGQYVGTYIAWSPTNGGWWGEGEMKFYMDGDTKFPTITGTGTEDYFLGSYGFVANGKPTEYTDPFVGVPQILPPDADHKFERYSMYRWHIMDPIRFGKDLRVTIQDLGWKEHQLYLAQQSDITSVVYWYQTEPHAPFPPFPSKEELTAKSITP
jgi:hypothetical protein